MFEDFSFLSTIHTFWSNVPISDLWFWLPADIVAVCDVVMTILAISAMFGLFRSFLSLFRGIGFFR